MDIQYLSQHFTTPPTTWTQEEISTWLGLLNMKEYQGEFEINKVDGLIIFDLEDSEIEEILGIKNSIHRKRLRNGINILRQLQSEMEKDKKKLGDIAAPKMFGTNFNESTQALSTSVINSQQAKIFSIKNDRFLQFNSQTAQRRELENVFNTNALANYDPESPFPGSKTQVLDSATEEEKDAEDIGVHPFGIRSADKKSPNVLEKPSCQTLVDINNFMVNQHAGGRVVNEEDKPSKQSNKKDQGKKLKKNSSMKSDLFKNIECENISPGGECFQHQEDSYDEKDHVPMNLNLKLDEVSHNHPLQPAELIIHPLDGVQSNNFYCINENGGRIGRHSNNEIVILEESVSRYHAGIEFRENKFFLTDIGSTTGTFIKILTPLILSEGMILEMGSNQFYVERIIIENMDNGILHLKVIEGMHADRIFVIENTATIGRKGQFGPTTIALCDDLHLSNTHTKISFSESKFILEDLGSTNGSWLRMSAENAQSQQHELMDGMVFKIGALSTFKVKRSNTNYLQSPKNVDGSTNCAICYENDRDAVFLPCKHNVSCLKCSKNIKQCPVCRFKITDLIRIYKS